MLVECRYCSVCDSFHDSVYERCPFCDLYKSYEKLQKELNSVLKAGHIEGHNETLTQYKQATTKENI